MPSSGRAALPRSRRRAMLSTETVGNPALGRTERGGRAGAGLRQVHDDGPAAGAVVAKGDEHQAGGDEEEQGHFAAEECGGREDSDERAEHGGGKSDTEDQQGESECGFHCSGFVVAGS